MRGHSKGVLMKAGQLLSIYDIDVGGPLATYQAALQRLQADAPPMDFATAREVVETDLGAPVEDLFAEFSPGMSLTPRAMRTGQRSAAAEVAEQIAEELDYRHEARSIRRFADLYRDHPFVRVPDVFDSHSGDRVITMTFLRRSWVGRGPRVRSGTAWSLGRGDQLFRLRRLPSQQRVQRGSAPGQLPVPRRRDGGIRRLRLRQAVPRAGAPRDCHVVPRNLRRRPKCALSVEDRTRIHHRRHRPRRGRRLPVASNGGLPA